MIQGRLYTNDETDVRYKNHTNKIDSAVKREKIFAFRKQVLEARAQKERE